MMSEQIYLGRIIAASMNLPDNVFRLWTTLFSMEVSQENYSPVILEEKQKALEAMQVEDKEEHKNRVRAFSKLSKLTVDDDDLRPAAPSEIEAFRRKLRKRFVRKAKK